MSKWNNSQAVYLDVLDKMPDSGMEYKTDPAAYVILRNKSTTIGSAIVGISQGYFNGGNRHSIDLKTL